MPSIRLHCADIPCQVPTCQTSMNSVMEDMTYYLRKHLEVKPNLNSTVAADLTEKVFIYSTGRLPSTNSTMTKCKGDKSKVKLHTL